MRAVASAALVIGILIAMLRSGPSAVGSQKNDSGRHILEQLATGRQRAYEGRLMVVTFGVGGPDLTEVRVARRADGTVLVGGARWWPDEGGGEKRPIGEGGRGALLGLAGGLRARFPADRLTRKYTVEVAGHRRLKSGPTTVLVIRERGASTPRERLYVNRSAGVVVRRETYDRHGWPLRLVAFTALDLAPANVPRVGEGWVTEDLPSASTPVSEQSIRVLEEVGWTVPRRLGNGFELLGAALLGDPDGSSLRLLFSDGLYSLSLYEQDGRLDRDALEGGTATPATLGEVTVYRWADTHPPAYVWTDGDRTFTAVSDAPRDMLAGALAGLPHDPPTGLLLRLRRGLTRVVSWLWPLG